MRTMTIGRLANQAGVNVDTIRYYEHVRGVKRRAEERLEQVEHKIGELKRVRKGLKILIDACPGHGDLEHCPIVAALSGEDVR